MATSKKIIKIPTESAVKRMASKDYMSPEMLLFFRDRLETTLKEVKEDITANRNEMSALETSTELVDMAGRQEILQLGLKRIERQCKHLDKINDALKRIVTGEYGYCEESGEPIGVPRLLARPTATLSIVSKEHQEFQERTEGVSRIGSNDSD